MNDFVVLYQNKEPRASTFLFWKEFGYKEHRTLKRVISENIHLFESKGELITASVDAENKKRGRPDESYMLNERQFVLLVMLVKNTPQSIEFKNRIEQEFFRMREMLANLAVTSGVSYKQVRGDGKDIYKKKSDVIKEFIEYATGQGSRSANMYYTNLANMENKALFLLEQKYPNVRDFLDVRQLMQVATADQIIEKALKEGMDAKLDYHDIYELAKLKTLEFSKIIGKSPVLLLKGNK